MTSLKAISQTATPQQRSTRGSESGDLTITPIARRTGRIAIAVLAVASCLGLATACSSTATAPADLAGDTSPPAISSPGSASGSTCASAYHRGAFSLDIVMQNNTGQTLTLDPSLTGRGDGHWASRPPTTLENGSCAVINAYSNDTMGGLWLTATYQLPEGTYIPFACAAQNLDGGAADCNLSAFTTMKGMDPDQMIEGNTSAAWQITVASSSGTNQTHWTLVAAPAN